MTRCLGSKRPFTRSRECCFFKGGFSVPYTRLHVIRELCYPWRDQVDGVKSSKFEYNLRRQGRSSTINEVRIVFLILTHFGMPFSCWDTMTGATVMTVIWKNMLDASKTDGRTCNEESRLFRNIHKPEWLLYLCDVDGCNIDRCEDRSRASALLFLLIPLFFAPNSVVPAREAARITSKVLELLCQHVCLSARLV